MNKQRSTECPSLLPYIPDELISQILLRLPVRSLLRFQCVCKSWLFRISNPQFAKSHFDLDASPSHRILLNNTTFSFKIKTFNIDSSLHDDESAVVNLKFPLAPPRLEFHHHGSPFHPASSRFTVLGSCRGFVFLANDEGDITVWNPSTGERRPIPGYFTPSLEFLYGIGYDKSTDDYLLVYIKSNELFVPEYETQIKVFSLKANSDFSFSVNAEYVDLGYYYRPGLFLNGSLHWLVKSRVKNVRLVLAFDLREKCLLEIPLPASRHDLVVELANGEKEYYLRVMGGCLCLCYSRVGGMTEIWMMKEYKVESSWTKIVLSAYDIPRNCFFPICFTKCGDVFGSNEFGRLLKLNDKGKLLEHRALWKGNGEMSYRLLHTHMYTESLLSLPEIEDEYYPPFCGFEGVVPYDHQPGDLDQGSEDEQQASEDDQQPTSSEEEIANDFDEAGGDDIH